MNHLFLTLDEAAEALHLRDWRTVVKWADEGRIRADHATVEAMRKALG